MEGRELPVGWAKCALGAVIRIHNGYAFKSSDFASEGVPLVRQANLKDRAVDVSECVYLPWSFLEEYQRFALKKGDILIGMSGSIGKISVYSEERPALQNQRTGKVVIPSQVLIDSTFLRHFLGTIEAELTGRGKGLAVQNISAGDIEEIRFPLAPLNEQRRIAAKLDTTLAAVDSCRQRLEGVATLIKRFRQAVLEAATSGALTWKWREENALPHDTAGDEIAAIIEKRMSKGLKARLPSEPDLNYWDLEPPDSWMTGSVSMLAECLDSQRVPVKKEKRRSAEGLYPYYGANGLVDMVDDYIFDDEIVLVTEDETFYGREKPIAYRSSGKCWVNNHAHVLRPQDGVAADYLCYCLMHYPVLPWLTGTTGRAKLTQAVLNSLPIAIPPAAEMQQIVIQVQSLFSLADQLEAKLSAARHVVERLTPALLAKAFRGELVPQDPGDEPASELLARLAAKRWAARQADAAAAGPSRRGRRKAAATPEPSLLDAAPLPPDLLATLLRECGALSGKALLAASELDPVRFDAQLQREMQAGRIRRIWEDGEELWEALG